MSDNAPLLRIRDLTVAQPREARAEIEGLSFTLEKGATLTLLGDATSGKHAVLRFLTNAIPRSATATGMFQVGHASEQPVTRKPALDLRLAYLPGPNAPVLTPHASVLSQLCLIIARRLRQPKASARAELALALERLPGAPSLEYLDYRPALVTPEMLATALLAAAMAQTPDLLLADDPLGELSPSHARSLAAVLQTEQKRLGFSLLYFAASAQAASLLGGNLIVLRSGRIVEEGPVSRLSTTQAHAYTQALFQAVTGSEKPLERAPARGEPLLRVQGLQVGSRGKSNVRDSVSFELRRGASLALLGEVGSGRRSFARTLIGLDPPASGRIVFDQVDIGVLSAGMMARLRRRIAFITGDDDALDPRMTVSDTVSEPLRAHLSMPRDLIAHNRDAALKRVGLAAMPGSRTVATLSPFDRRRLQIARAIVSQPLLAVIDEPLRGLDAFAQSVVRDLLRNFRSNEGAAILLITSDFGLARAFCEDVFVFKDGRAVERGPIANLMRAPQDPHTKKLLEAVAAAPVSAPVPLKPPIPPEPAPAVAPAEASD
jgi:peptide/nickel transport system ATP-binding protein